MRASSHRGRAWWNVPLLPVAVICGVAGSLGFAATAYGSPAAHATARPHLTAAQVSPCLRGDVLKRMHAHRVHTQLTPTGNSLQFSHLLHHYCNASGHLHLRLVRHGKRLEVWEIFAAKKVTHCSCLLEASGTIGPLAPGNYSVTFVNDNRFAHTKSRDGPLPATIGSGAAK